MAKASTLAYLLMISAGVVWGLTFSLTRLAAVGGAHPLGLTLWQSFGGAVLLLAICLARRRLPSLRWAALKRYLFLGLMGSAIPGPVFFYAAPHVPAGILAITVATVPLVTYGASWLMRIDVFSARRMAGLLIGLIAIGLIVGPETSLPERSMVFWVLIVAAASLCFTVENIYVALFVPEDTDMLAMLCGMLLASSLVLLPLVLAVDGFVPLNQRWTQTEWSVAGLAVATTMAYALYLYVIRLAGPVFASQAGYVVTVFGVIWAIAIFGERHSLWIWSAMALLLVGLALVTPRNRPTRCATEVAAAERCATAPNRTTD